jgi:hypothetical protein
MKCDRCGKVIRFPTFSTKEDQRTAYKRGRNGILEEEHYITESICFWCGILDRLFSWAKENAVLLLAAVVILGVALIWYAPSREARSQETSVTYRNPDFPCVTAIDPTVTDFACVAAIARRH